jgi:hypothetical protein
MPNSKPADLTADTAPVDPTLVLLAQTAAGTADYKVVIGDLPVSTPQATAIAAADAVVQAAAVQRANHTGTQAISTVTGLQTALDAKQATSAKGVANGYASLDANGKVPVTQIPQSAFTSVDVVASQAAMLALSGAVEGALALRTDTEESYVLSTNSPSTLADWELFSTSSAVDSVDGLTGAVDLSGSYDAAGTAATLAATKQPLDADLTALAAAGNSAVLAATTASFTTADETKLDGIEAGATEGVIVYEYNGSTWVRNTVPVKLFVNRIDDTLPVSGFTDGVDIFLTAPAP